MEILIYGKVILIYTVRKCNTFSTAYEEAVMCTNTTLQSILNLLLCFYNKVLFNKIVPIKTIWYLQNTELPAEKKGDGRCRIVQVGPQQAGPKIPTSLNVRKKMPSLIYVLYSLWYTRYVIFSYVILLKLYVYEVVNSNLSAKSEKGWGVLCILSSGRYINRNKTRLMTRISWHFTTFLLP